MVMMTQNDTIFCVNVYLGNMAPTPNRHVTSLCCSHVLSCLSRLVCSHQPFTMGE